MDEQQQERLIRYERDGSATLIDGTRTRTIAAGAGAAALDAAAAAFFAGDEG